MSKLLNRVYPLWPTCTATATDASCFIIQSVDVASKFVKEGYNNVIETESETRLESAHRPALAVLALRGADNLIAVGTHIDQPVAHTGGEIAAL